MRKTRKRDILALLTGLLLAAIIAAGFTGCEGGETDTKKTLTGTVNISGTAEVGETLTAAPVNSNGTDGKFKYEWTRTPEGGTALKIAGANGQQYVITEADVNHTLGAVLSNEDTTGTISSAQTSKVPEPNPIAKTYTINFKDEALKFDVKYKALPSAAAPEYLAYLETRLGAILASASQMNIEAVEHLMSEDNRFTINVEYTGNNFSGIEWDTAAQSFKVHNGWISTASGTDLTLTMMRDAFNSVEIITAMLKLRLGVFA